MATKYNRFWYIDSNRIGIVEKTSSTVSKDGWESNYTSVTEGKSMRIYAISQSTDIATNDSTTNVYNDIPQQFHEGIVYKAIANFYKDPRNMDMTAAQVFDSEYEMKVRSAKKYARTRYVTTGTIKPYDY